MASKAPKERSIMLIEIGGGLNPHPAAAIIIDPIHPLAAPAQRAQDGPWMYMPKVAARQKGWMAASERENEYATLPDGCADEVYGSHVMEHIPRGGELISTMNEAWRVLRPGGCFTFLTPLVGFTEPRRSRGRLVATWQPYADPSHVNFWWLPEAVLYFCEGTFKAAADYGVKTWMPLGDFVPEKRVTDAMQAVPAYSFWSVRYGWEGVVRIMKPATGSCEP
jgi:SAM-dependent methyltransferase